MSFLATLWSFVITVFLLGTSLSVPKEPIVPDLNSIPPIPEVLGTTTVEIPKRESNILYAVVKVVDGDTLSVAMGGQSETIRLIGVNTPETVDPRRAVQCFGTEASNEMKRLLSGQQVQLVLDPSQGSRDKYGRLLAYIYRADGLFINKYLIAEGYAYEYTYNAPYRFQAEFKAAQVSAQTSERGLWGPGACAGSASAASAAAAAAVVPVSIETGAFECSRNAYNCTQFKTQAQAQAVFEACGGAARDIHKLDVDGDGQSCESLP